MNIKYVRICSGILKYCNKCNISGSKFFFIFFYNYSCKTLMLCGLHKLKNLKNFYNNKSFLCLKAERRNKNKNNKKKNNKKVRKAQ